MCVTCVCISDFLLPSCVCVHVCICVPARACLSVGGKKKYWQLFFRGRAHWVSGRDACIRPPPGSNCSLRIWAQQPLSPSSHFTRSVLLSLCCSLCVLVPSFCVFLFTFESHLPAKINWRPYRKNVLCCFSLPSSEWRPVV